MSEQAGPTKEKPKSVVIDASSISPATTQEITIQLQKPNKNRVIKAIIGIILIIIGPTIMFQDIEDEGSCVICFLSMGLGLSLFFQSFHKNEVSAARGISYFLISACLVFFTFFALLFYALSSVY